MTRPEDVLKRHWGYDAFRGPQRAAIDAVVTGNRDVLVVMATGGGKSLCMQVTFYHRGVGPLPGPPPSKSLTKNMVIYRVSRHSYHVIVPRRMYRILQTQSTHQNTLYRIVQLTVHRHERTMMIPKHNSERGRGAEPRFGQAFARGWGPAEAPPPERKAP